MRAKINGVWIEGTPAEIKAFTKGKTNNKKASKPKTDKVKEFKEFMEGVGATLLKEQPNKYTRKDGSKVEGMLFNYKLSSGKTAQYQNTLKHPQPFKL